MHTRPVASPVSARETITNVGGLVPKRDLRSTARCAATKCGELVGRDRHGWVLTRSCLC